MLHGFRTLPNASFSIFTCQIFPLTSTKPNLNFSSHCLMNANLILGSLGAVINFLIIMTTDAVLYSSKLKEKEDKFLSNMEN